MRDAFGGIVNIAMIVVFLVLVSGYLAFNVNYTKAFRVKNKIISTFEEYEGPCNNPSDTCFIDVIQPYMKQIGYSASEFDISGYICPNKSGYCYKEVATTTGGTDRRNKTTYRIVTQINIDIPIINKIMPELKIFQVSGDTKPIVVR